jgi:hypothetical protein
LNDHFLLTIGGHDAELTVTSEDFSTGQTSQIGGMFIDPSTGVSAAWGGQLSLTNTMKIGYPVENLVLGGGGSKSVIFTGTVWGAGSGDNFFGNDQLIGTGSDQSFYSPYPCASGQVLGNDYDSINAKYQSLGGTNGVLGKWVSMEATTPYGGGIYQKFHNGAIYWSVSTGVHYLEGPIWTEYQATAT